MTKKVRKFFPWKILAFTVVIVSVLTCIFVLNLGAKGYYGDFLGNLSEGVSLAVELPIFLAGVAFLVFKWKGFKFLALVALVAQIIIVAGFFSAKTSTQTIGEATSPFLIKWKNETPVGILKIDYKAPFIYLNTPVNVGCWIESSNCGYVKGESLISADVTDNVKVKRVKIYVDNTLLKDFLASPYEVSFDFGTISKGLHQIKVFAQDTSGNTTDYSAGVIVE